MLKRLSRLKSLWRRHGPIRFFTLAVLNCAYQVRYLRHAPAGAPRIDPLDEKYGTDTSGVREVGSLDVADCVSARSAVRYQPSGWEAAQTAFSQLNIDYQEYSLIDFGSGKGRVLLVAAGFPFKDVIGIEFSTELHDIACRNVARLAPDAIRAGAVRSVRGDAATFELPNSDLVCYFYNPFGPPIISMVAQHLQEHYTRGGHRIIIIYVDPRHRTAFETTGNFRVLKESGHSVILATPNQIDISANKSGGEERC